VKPACLLFILQTTAFRASAELPLLGY